VSQGLLKPLAEERNSHRLVTVGCYARSDAPPSVAVDPGRSTASWVPNLWGKARAVSKGCVTDWQQETRSLILLPANEVRHVFFLERKGEGQRSGPSLGPSPSLVLDACLYSTRGIAPVSNLPRNQNAVR